MMRRMRWAPNLALVLSYSSAFAASCTVSAPATNFGNYSGVIVTSSTQLTVNCTSGLAYEVGTNSGQHQGSGNYNWNMLGPGGALLHYLMFRDSARTQPWGNSPHFDTVDSTGSGSAQTITIYTTLPGGEYVAPGSYTDSVTVSAFSSAPTATATLIVTATVQAGCAISASPLAFGTSSGLLINSTSTISVTCTNTTPYDVGLDAGSASGATVTTRSMTGPAAALLGYQLFSNSGRTTNWGNTVGTSTVAGTGSGTLQSVTVYGQIAAAQYARPGAYTDTITATITY